MYNYLTNHALNNVWCSSDQDHQFLFKPTRISPSRGVRGYAEIEWEKIKLPDNTKYHIYQIGQLAPSFVKLFPNKNTWFNIGNNDNTLIDVYTRYGIEIPKDEAFLIQTNTRNFVLAVKENKKIIEVDKTSLFIRFYTNAFFNSIRYVDGVDRVYSETHKIMTRTDVINFQNKVASIRSNGYGEVYLFANGYIVNKVHPDHFEVGDTLEFIHDTTIKQVVDFKVNELDTFVSKLDNIRKYLIYRTKNDNNVIDFKDDIDLWVMTKDDIYDNKGIFYHKFGPESIRMITHKDYSIPVASITELTNVIDELNMDDNLFIRLHIREAGYERPLTFESSRIHDLIKLEDGDIKRAMVGTNSSLDIWKASNLELSNYTKIMRNSSIDINDKLVQDAYGYNQFSKILGDTPSKPINYNGNQMVELPYKLSYNSSLFEYTTDGKLIGPYINNQGQLYDIKSSNCGYVEGIVGVLDSTTGINYGSNCVDIPTDTSSFGCYYCPLIGGAPNYEWAMGEIDTHYKIINNQVTWLLDPEEYYFATKFDNYVLFNEISLTIYNGLLSFDITSVEKWCSGDDESMVEGTLLIEPGKIDIFLNNRPIIENLDYYVNWPRVVIANKEYLNQNTDLQNIRYRCTGLCNYDMKRQPVKEFGFIEHGLMSRNNRFDVRDDKVLRFVAGGRIWSRDELGLSEDPTEHNLGIIENGTPYVIDDIVVPMDEFIDTITYSFRAEAEVKDKKVSDYMTLYYPEPDKGLISIIEKRYDVISPFISKIIKDMEVGNLRPEFIRGQYGDDYIRTVLKDYEWLLDFDPVIKTYDERYVKIHPHQSYSVIELDPYQYNFLSRIINIYLNREVDLTGHVSINEGLM